MQTQTQRRGKKRGSRGGVKKRLKARGCRKLPLPTITLLNARSISNKMDELAALINYDGDYKRTNLFCVTETWLSEEKTDINITGYTTIRFDRDQEKTEKGRRKVSVNRISTITKERNSAIRSSPSTSPAAT
ncbi:hypothetical protein C0Q70_04221 [Pomacea canaliculata]|uniref:Uncharacterized protein n=1 Tax=Pomacea canaliculata TaxID=400727 RepID=A0A2T7PUW5_POMCA|nr:hypothetical protein C0Q70_04221 [Pomacea canaliculata]